jgi:hypothetical protein
MKSRVKKTLLIPVLAVGLMTVVLPADATVYPYQQATSHSGGAVTSTSANDSIPFSIDTGRKVH